MKKISKVKFTSLFIAFAIIAALAISCAPPEVGDVTEYDFGPSDDRFDAEKNAGTSNLSFSFQTGKFEPRPTSATWSGTIEIAVTLPDQSDALKKSPITTADLSFLSFHTFTKAAATDYNKADTLGTALTFTVDRQSINTVYVKVSHTINTAADYSNLVAKIDGTKYTHSNGVKMDRNGDLKTGEAIFDDYYSSIDIGGSNGIFNAPRSLGWTISLNALSVNPTFSSNTATTSENVTSITAVSAPLGGIQGATQADIDTARKNILQPLAGQFKIQKYSGTGDTWTDYKTAEWDDTTNSIVYKNVTFDHKGIYRTIWKGSPLTTSTEYYGVKQPIVFNGNVTQSNVNQYARTEIRSYEQVVLNSDVYYYDYYDYPFSTGIYSADSEGKNIVLEVTVSEEGSGTTADPYIGLKELSISAFNDAFKIVVSKSSFNSATDLIDSSDYTFAVITKVEFKKNTYGSGTSEVSIFDTILITLDPAVTTSDLGSNIYYWVNDSLGYTNGKYLFGNPANARYGNFELYPFN